jgi:Fic family protein
MIYMKVKTGLIRAENNRGGEALSGKKKAMPPTREGYEVGSRPPSTLSAKATRQLQRAHVSPKLISIMEKAHSAQVIRVTGKAKKLELSHTMTSLPSQMTPFMPIDNGHLEDLSSEVLSRSAKLSGVLTPNSQIGIIDLIRQGNSYYSNLIEDHNTPPAEVEQAMRSDYSTDPAKHNLQVESLAHIHCQEAISLRLAREPDLDPSTPEFLAWVHGQFYEKLPDELKWVENPDTREKIKVIGGEFRKRNVAVGKHLPPEHGAIPTFLNRFFETYKMDKFHGAKPLIAFAAAHHRLMWIHPFLDGNGRVARFYTDACFSTFPVEGYGLWNVSRGLARNRDGYMRYLGEADAPRQGALDGRGNLSNRTLKQFCEFFLMTCLDQIDYMAGMLQLQALLGRITGYIQARNDKRIPPPPGHTAGMKLDAAKMLQEVLLRGEMGRSEVAALATTARRGSEILAQLLAEGILISSMPKSPVRLAFPTHLAGHLFPELFPMV